jgi:hypothetical protein
MKSNENSIFEKNFLPGNLLNDFSEVSKLHCSDSDDSESENTKESLKDLKDIKDLRDQPSLIIDKSSSTTDEKRRSANSLNNLNSEFSGLNEFRSNFDREGNQNNTGINMPYGSRILMPPKNKNYSHQNLTGKYFYNQNRVGHPNSCLPNPNNCVPNPNNCLPNPNNCLPNPNNCVPNPNSCLPNPKNIFNYNYKQPLYYENLETAHTPQNIRNSINSLNSLNSANSCDHFNNQNFKIFTSNTPIQPPNFHHSDKLVNFYVQPKQSINNFNMSPLQTNYNNDIIHKLNNLDLNKNYQNFHPPIKSSKNLNIINEQILIGNSSNTPKKNYYSAGLSNNLVSNIICESLIEENEEDFEVFLDKIGENLIPFIKTQRGSRFLQKFMNKILPDVLDKFFELLSPKFKEIMNDNYGNYFIQKLMQTCSIQQRLFFIHSV